LQFNVAALLIENTGSTREYDVDDDLRVEGEAHRVRGHVRFDRTPAGILVRARLAGEMNSECSRCLKPITFPVSIEIEEEYIPAVDIGTGAHVEAPKDAPEAYRISERHILDLGESAAQYWAIALPLAPVCDEDCLGLCPICGAEIAAEGHTCPREQMDARWEKLAKLKLG
jgi:uncharacterized protein